MSLCYLDVNQAAAGHARRPQAGETTITPAGAGLYARHFLSALPRSDQRRWAEVFIRGLIAVPGRKTIRKISGYVAEGGDEQCLQQFLNQSTWRWDAVRRALAVRLAEEQEPLAWVVKDVVLPKNGRNSVGVARQYAHPVGRLINCQLSIAVFLVGSGWSCPVNWRLMLPPSWDEDKELRKKAHLPDDEHHLPRWQHVLDAIDEMTAEWGLRPLPVLADMTNDRQLYPLLRGLEERRLPYVIQVSPGQPAVTVTGPTGVSQTMSFQQFISDSVARGTAVLNVWQLPVGRPGRTQLIAARLPADTCPKPAVQRGAQPRHGSADAWPGVPRYAAAEWSPVRGAPRHTWVTSSAPGQLPGILDDIALMEQTAVELDGLYDGLGLGHFEGRSFAGWHHYVTLVSVAYACREFGRPGDWPAEPSPG
jgi:hypothetical protein